MSIETKEITYGAFGRCMQLSNGLIELVVTLDIGPRVIRFAAVGGENMFAELPDDAEPEIGWKNWGGHRLWTSPEEMPRSYEMDNDPVEYELTENGIVLRHAKDPVSGMVKEIEITMDEETTCVDVLHRVYNLNAWPVEFADWALTVTDRGGKVVVPFNTNAPRYLSNRHLALWTYSRMNDSRLWMGERYLTLTQDPSMEHPFKIGMDNEEGWAATFNHGCVFIKHFLYDTEGKYPDGGMSFETYTNSSFLEVETLSPLETILPGEYLEHFECWELLPGVEMPENDDEALDAFAAFAILPPECDGDCAHCSESCGKDTCVYSDDEEE